MSKLKDHLACTGIFLGLSLGQVCLAQNVSFPEDVTIRRNTNAPNNPAPSFPSNPTANPNNTNQYLVYVPNPTNLSNVKTVAPDAFVSSLDSGERVVQVGRFNNLDLAQKRVEEPRRSGLEAQLKTAGVVSTQVPDTSITSIPIAPTMALPDVPSSIPITNNTSNNASILTVPPAIAPLPAPPNITENSATNEAIRNRFFVIIPSTEDSVLGKARTIVPTSSGRGTYIEAQGYPDRSSAETLNVTMRSQGLDSRVIFY